MAALIEYTRQNRLPPTINELQTMLGLRAQLSVSHSLRMLERRGMVRLGEPGWTGKRTARSIRIVNGFFPGNGFGTFEPMTAREALRALGNIVNNASAASVVLRAGGQNEP